MNVLPITPRHAPSPHRNPRPCGILAGWRPLAAPGNRASLLAGALSVAVTMSPGIVAAQDAASNVAGGKSADEIAKELANPNNALAKLTFKNQFRWYEGDLPGADGQSNYTMLFQPVFPFPLGVNEAGAKEIMFVRPAFPILFDQPVPGAAGWDDVSALGDMGFDFAYAQTLPSGFLWAAGLVGTIPTATDSAVAGKQWRFGPECLFAKQYDWGLIGIFPSHQWDVAGWGDGPSFSTTQVQLFLNFTPGGGWVIGSTPIMNYNWQSGEWTIPINLTVSKTIHVGNTPLKLELDINYYVDHPDAFGPEWMVGFNITPVIHNFINDWFHR